MRRWGLPSTVAGVSFSTFVPQNIVAVVVHESATAQEAVLLDGGGSVSKERNGDHFFLENSKKE